MGIFFLFPTGDLAAPCEIDYPEHYGFPRPACEPAVGIMHSEKNTVVQGPCGSAEARQRGEGAHHAT